MYLVLVEEWDIAVDEFGNGIKKLGVDSSHCASFSVFFESLSLQEKCLEVQ
jgi:hypothetical protein